MKEKNWGGILVPKNKHLSTGLDVILVPDTILL